MRGIRTVPRDSRQKGGAIVERFCTYCGKPLPEDGVCGCQPDTEETTSLDTPRESAPVAEPKAAEETAAQESCTQTDMAQDLPMFQPAPASENLYWKKLKEPMGRLKSFLLDYWRDPIKATTGVLKARDSALAVTMMVLHVVLAGLVLFVASSKLLHTAVESVAGASGGRTDIYVPLFTTWMVGARIAIIALALSVLAVFVQIKLTRVNAGFYYVLLAVGVNTVFSSAALLLALLFILFGWWMGAALALVLGAVFWCGLMTLLLVKIFGLPMTGSHLTMAAVLMTVVLSMTVCTGGKLCEQATAGMYVAGQSLEDRLDDWTDSFGSLNDLF